MLAPDKKRAPCLAPFEVPVQIVFASGHTSEGYVTDCGWEQASIQRCPVCHKGIRSHGTYARKFPAGTRIARFYCRPCHVTVSLLPDFLAAGYGETLDVQGNAVDAVERCSTFEAAQEVRPDIQLQGARRWLRRRVRRHRLGARLVATALGTDAVAMTPATVRGVASELLQQLPTPAGLAHRRIGHWLEPKRLQQSMGPDPP